MKLSHVEDIMAEGKAVIQFILWLADLSAALGQLAPNPQWASAPRGVWTCSLLQAALLTVQPPPYFGGTGNASFPKSLPGAQ